MFSRAIRFSVIVLIAFAILRATNGVVASAADPTATTLTLLEVGWKSSPAAFDAAREQYDKLQAGASRDLRASYAMTLIAIRHHKARDASQFIDAALASKPSNLHLRKAKLWLQVLNKDYKSAVAGMPAIANDVSAAAKNDKASRDLLAEHAKFLGELLAFIGGPAEASIRDEQAADLEKKLLTILPFEAHEAYNAGKESVAEKQKALEEDLRNVRTEAKIEGQTKREAELSKLKKDREEYTAEADEIRRPYDVQLQQLSAVLAELKRTDYPIVKKSNKDDKNDKGRETTNNAYKIKSTEANISNLKASLAADLEPLVKQDQRAATRMFQLEKQSKRVSTTGFEESANSTAIRKTLTALSTYSEFPLEQEREKLVQSYGKK